MKYNIITPNGKTTVIADSKLVAMRKAAKAMDCRMKDIGYNIDKSGYDARMVFVSLAKD